jgi:hypothetical protein
MRRAIQPPLGTTNKLSQLLGHLRTPAEKSLEDGDYVELIDVFLREFAL